MKHRCGPGQARAVLVHQLDRHPALSAAGNRLFAGIIRDVSRPAERPPVRALRQGWAVRVADIVDELHRPEWLKDEDRYRIRGDRAAIISPASPGCDGQRT